MTRKAKLLLVFAVDSLKAIERQRAVTCIGSRGGRCRLCDHCVPDLCPIDTALKLLEPLIPQNPEDLANWLLPRKWVN